MVAPLEHLMYEGQLADVPAHQVVTNAGFHIKRADVDALIALNMKHALIGSRAVLVPTLDVHLDLHKLLIL